MTNKMTKFKIKTGDTVQVITGDNKGTEGKVLKIFKDKNKAVVEGVNMVKKHTKPSAKNPQGGIIEKEAPIHISNLSLLTKKEKQPELDINWKVVKKWDFLKNQMK